MRLYIYLFTCAYWVCMNDLKEKSAPQEYAFLFISIINFQFLVTIMGLVNIIIGHNIFNGGIVIISCMLIAGINYLILLRKKKYILHLDRFKELSSPDFKRIRVKTMIVSFLIAGLLAIAVSVLNHKYLIHRH